jgi:hypothetical protein
MTGAGSIPVSQAGLYELELKTAAWLYTRPAWMTSPWTYSAIGGGTTYVLTEDLRASLETAAVPLLMFPERASGDIARNPVFCGSNQTAAIERVATPRSTAIRNEYLRSLVHDYRTPSWMIPWLERGRVPPGYQVDHIIPLSIGGADALRNMRLQAIDLHRIHHRYYRPWEW